MEFNVLHLERSKCKNHLSNNDSLVPFCKRKHTLSSGGVIDIVDGKFFTETIEIPMQLVLKGYCISCIVNALYESTL